MTQKHQQPIKILQAHTSRTNAQKNRFRLQGFTLGLLLGSFIFCSGFYVFYFQGQSLTPAATQGSSDDPVCSSNNAADTFEQQNQLHTDENFTHLEDKDLNKLFKHESSPSGKAAAAKTQTTAVAQPFSAIAHTTQTMPENSSHPKNNHHSAIKPSVKAEKSAESPSVKPS